MTVHLPITDENVIFDEKPSGPNLTESIVEPILLEATFQAWPSADPELMRMYV